MAKLSISAAAKEWGVARSTIQRKIKQGDLSATSNTTGTKTIDTSELLRVFGESKGVAKDMPHTTQSDRLIQDALQAEKQLSESLKSEIGFLRRMNENLNSQNESLIAQVETLNKELTNSRKPTGLLSWFGNKS